MRGGLTGRVADVHLPSRKACSLQFLQQLAEGTKKMVDRAKVPANRVPQWPELAVRLLSPNVLADPQLKDYFPDKFRAGKAPERDFFWGVLFAVNPLFARAIIKEAMELRNKAPQGFQDDPAKHLVIESSILQKMLEAPEFTGK